jgi:hypothetical protein
MPGSESDAGKGPDAGPLTGLAGAGAGPGTDAGAG